MTRLVKEAREHRKVLGFVFLVGALIAVPGFLVPGLTGVFVNDILIQGYREWLPLVIVALLGAVAVLGALA